MRRELGKEFKELEKQGKTEGKKAGTFINPKVKAFEAERKSERDSGIDALTKKFEKEIPEQLKVFKQIATLPTTTKDACELQDALIRLLNVHPENIKVLASEDDFNKIVTHVRGHGEEMKKPFHYYHDAKDLDTSEEWLIYPQSWFGSQVPDNLLAAVKASYLITTQCDRNELL